MAKRSSSTKSSEVKAQIARLRKKGLTKAKPKGRPGGSAYALIRKLKPVLEKRASVVKLDKKARDKYKDQFPIVKGKAIVPVRKGERISVSKKTGELRRIKTVGKRKFKFRVMEKGEMLEPLPGNENTVYRFTWNNGYTEYVVGRQAAENFVAHYDVGNFLSGIEVVTEEDMENAA